MEEKEAESRPKRNDCGRHWFHQHADWDTINDLLGFGIEHNAADGLSAARPNQTLLLLSWRRALLMKPRGNPGSLLGPKPSCS